MVQRDLALYMEVREHDSFVGLLPEHQIKLWFERLLPTEAERRVTEANKVAQIDSQVAEHKYREVLELDPDLAKTKIGLAVLLLT